MLWASVDPAHLVRQGGLWQSMFEVPFVAAMTSPINLMASVVRRDIAPSTRTACTGRPACRV